MSTRVIASILAILAVVLPLFGIEFSNTAWTTVIQDVVVVGGALWVWFRTVSAGNLTLIGTAKKG